MIRLNSQPTVGFGEEVVVRPLPPLELRTAYTVKGLGIGAGGLLGYAGNRAAVNAERDFTKDGAKT